MLVTWQISSFYEPANFLWQQTKTINRTPDRASPPPPTCHPHPDHHHLEHPSGPTAAILNIENIWYTIRELEGARNPDRSDDSRQLAAFGHLDGKAGVIWCCGQRHIRPRMTNHQLCEECNARAPMALRWIRNPRHIPSSETEQSTRRDPETHVKLSRNSGGEMVDCKPGIPWRRSWTWWHKAGLGTWDGRLPRLFSRDFIPSRRCPFGRPTHSIMRPPVL